MDRNIYKANCASSYIYLIEFIFCNKRYLVKAGASFNSELHNDQNKSENSKRSNGWQTVSRRNPSLQQRRFILPLSNRYGTLTSLQKLSPSD